MLVVIALVVLVVWVLAVLVVWTLAVGGVALCGYTIHGQGQARLARLAQGSIQPDFKRARVNLVLPITTCAKASNGTYSA